MAQAGDKTTAAVINKEKCQIKKYLVKKWVVIAGPCAAESRDQILTTARGIKAAGGDVIRAGLGNQEPAQMLGRDVVMKD